MLPEPILVVKKVAAAFERLSIRYVVGGSVASSFHGLPRATLDVDLVAELAASHAKPLAAALEAEFYVDAEMIADAVQRRASFNVIYLPSMFKADIFVVKADPWWALEMDRGQVERIGEGESAVTIRVATAEDTLLYKLVWYRLGAGSSDRQWLDVKGLIEVQGNDLDRAYLDQWARHLGVEDLLERSLAEAVAKR